MVLTDPILLNDQHSLDSLQINHQKDCNAPECFTEEMEKELLEIWKQQQPHICSICLDDTEINGNIILKCSNLTCDVSVHQKCYAVKSVLDPRKWKCHSCLDDENDENECVLCPQRGGAMSIDKSGKAWIHSICAIWIPEVKISGSSFDISKISMDTWSKYCYLCEDKHLAGIGACISCAHPTCKRSFHATCAMQWNILEDSQLNTSGQSFDCFCHEHAKKSSLSRKVSNLEPFGYDSYLKMNAWEKWRRLKTNLRDNISRSISSLISSRLELNPIICHIMKIDKSVSGSSDALQRIYAEYDNRMSTQYILDATSSIVRNARNSEISIMNQAAYRERAKLECEVYSLSIQRKNSDTQLSRLRSDNIYMKRAVTDIQEALLRIYTCSRKNCWSWQQLLTQSATSRQPRACKEPISNTPTQNQIISFVLNHNTRNIWQTNEEFSIVCGLPIDPSFQHPVNLDTILDLPSAPSPRKHSEIPIAVCKECHTRQLPDTAPVHRHFRDTLLTCSKCKYKYHLCCLETPLKSIPFALNQWECTTCSRKRSAVPSTKGRSSWNSTRSSSSSSLSDDLFTDESSDCTKRAKVRRAPSNYDLVPKSPQATKPIAASSRRQNPPKSIAPETNETMRDLKKSIYEITGPAPLIPPSLVKSQTGVYGDTVLRAFVFNRGSENELEQMNRVALWRVITNIPPGANPNDVAALKAEGERFGFGKFARAFHNTEVESMELSMSRVDYDNAMSLDSHSPIPDSDHVAECDMDDTGDGSSDQDYNSSQSRSCTKRYKKSPTIAGKGMKPERVPSLWNGDLYKPFWTRGNGKLKEGWCHLCTPGQWLKTKTSVYWYHMHNFHGVSSIGGSFFQSPVELRVSATTGLREGLCHHCRKWICIQGDKPVNVEEIYWYKHTQKCHKFDTAADADMME